MKGTFERTVAIGAVLLATFLIGNAWVSYRNLRHVSNDAGEVAHTHEVIEETDRLIELVLEIESGQRGYLISRDLDILEPAEVAFTRHGPQLTRLRSLVADNPDQSRRVDALATLIDLRLRESRRCIEATRRGDMESARSLVASIEGNRLMEKIRSTAEELEHAETSLLIKRQEAARRAYETAAATVFFSAAVGLAAVAIFTVVLARHLRSRVRGERVLFEQRELFRSTLAAIDDAVIVSGLDGRITFANPVAERLTAWTATEANHQALETVYRTAPRQPVLTGAPPESFDRILTSRSGTECPVEDSTNPLRDADGALTGRVLVFRDISARRRAETELRKLAASLAENDRRKDEFLATLAHELRNPLAPIRNGLEIIRLTSEDAAIQPVCDVMNRQLNHLVRLVDDLMDVSRISRNKLQLRLECIDLTSVIRTAIETCQPLIDANGHTLVVDIPKDVIEVNADHTRLAQVFSNLLNNAAKYTEPGGRIDLSANRDGDDVVVRVRDTGIGIAPAMLDRVFDLFAQIESSTDRAQGGLGIGLMLVKRLTEMHGGTITASSEGEGKGCEFTVRIPALRRRDREDFSDDEPSPNGAVHRVLVVDDNRDSAESLCRLLQLHGHTVYAAYDGAEALEIYRANRPDVVLLDIGLPSLTGYEVCQSIRAMPGGKDVLIIAQTGWGQDEDRRKSREAGFDHHFVKPVDSQSLMSVLGARTPPVR